MELPLDLARILELVRFSGQVKFDLPGIEFPDLEIPRRSRILRLPAYLNLRLGQLLLWQF